MSERPRLASFTARGKLRYGLVRDDGIVDLSARHEWPGLRQVIEAGKLAEIGEAAMKLPADFTLADVAFAIPVSDPEKIICVGVNYPDRNEEYKDGQAAPKFPSLFVRFPGSFVGHGAALVRPKASPQLDYEGEIALVIGKGGRHIAERDALDHIATAAQPGTNGGDDPVADQDIGPAPLVAGIVHGQKDIGIADQSLSHLGPPKGSNAPLMTLRAAQGKRGSRPALRRHYRAAHRTDQPSDALCPVPAAPPCAALTPIRKINVPKPARRIADRLQPPCSPPLCTVRRR